MSVPFIVCPCLSGEPPFLVVSEKEAENYVKTEEYYAIRLDDRAIMVSPGEYEEMETKE
jgi:hypothetical protein